MKEYIEREAAIEAVKKERDYFGKFSYEEERAFTVGFHQGISFALSDIAALPAADVRPVVLCRDCAEVERSTIRGCVYCNEHGRALPNDGWCSFGMKRKRDDNV